MNKEDLMKHPNLGAFIQHGFQPEQIGGQQVQGYSIFSGENSMWVHPTKKMWSCNKTGKNGGFKTWIQEVVKHCRDNIGMGMGKLVKDRGLLRKTIRHHEIGYNEVTDRYIVPIYDGNGDSFSDVKVYDMNAKSKKWKFVSTSGMTNSLYGQHTVKGSNGTIWLCEGEWDAIAMWEILQSVGLENDITLAVSGGTTFKNEWHGIFKDRDVRVLYDHDKTGFRGQNKVHKSISSLVRSIQYVHWDSIDNVKDNFDLRDYYIKIKKKNAKATFNGVKSFLEHTPHALAEGDEDKEQVEVEKLEGKFVHPRTVYKEYRQWLHMPDTTVLDVMFGSIIANRLPGDPLWMFIVAPSGMMKTELTLSISEAPYVVTTTSMTPHSLISGSNKGSADPSLIPRLDGKILAIKDFTTILNMNQMAKEEIFGILRDAYDGKTEKYFGNGVIRSYNSLFGLVAGVTPAIDMYTEGQTALGERFLKYRIPVALNAKAAIAFLQRAQANSNSEVDMRNSLRDIGKRVLSYDYHNLPIMPADIKERIVYAAYWTAQMRGTVVRNDFTQDQKFEPFVELGTRLTKQYTKLINGIGMFRGLEELGESEIQIITDIAVGSVPANREKIIRAVYKEAGEEEFIEKDIVKWIRGFAPEMVRKHMKDLVSLDIVRRTKKNGRNQAYKLNPEFAEVIEKGEVYP